MRGREKGKGERGKGKELSLDGQSNACPSSQKTGKRGKGDLGICGIRLWVLGFGLNSLGINGFWAFNGFS
jgi:hypothetical protein